MTIMCHNDIRHIKRTRRTLLLGHERDAFRFHQCTDEMGECVVKQRGELMWVELRVGFEDATEENLEEQHDI